MTKIRLDKLFVIAEMAQAHEGSVEKAISIVDAAAEAGADAIKLQVVFADELAVPAYQYYELYRRIEFSDEEWEELVKLARQKNLAVLADVFGDRSANIMSRLGADGYKIHTADISNLSLISKVARLGRPTFLSTGGNTPEEIEKAIKTVEMEGNENICLMHGYQVYPTKLEDTELYRINILREKYGFPVGFADHVDGDSPFAVILPLIALAAGATVIEKHITLDRSLKGEDYYSSLNPDEFKKMVQLLREAEKAIGSRKWEMSESEIIYRKNARKHLVAKRDLRKGERLFLDALNFKRSDSEEEPLDPLSVIGRTLKRDIKANTVIRLDDLE